MDKLKDWEFDAEELSANVYKVWGKDKLGRSVEKVGTNVDELMKKCKEEAIKITQVPWTKEA